MSPRKQHCTELVYVNVHVSRYGGKDRTWGHNNLIKVLHRMCSMISLLTSDRITTEY